MEVLQKLKSILYIEDNEVNRFVVGEMLHGKCNLNFAETGYEGIEYMRDNSYDVVLIDINLNDPDMDGFDVLHSMHIDGYIENTGCKVIAVTAYVGDEWQQKCIDAGFDDYISKPIRPNLLYKKAGLL